MDTTKSSQKFIDPIKEGMLSVRARNCCKCIGVENLFQLLEYAKSNDLYHIPAKASSDTSSLFRKRKKLVSAYR